MIRNLLRQGLLSLLLSVPILGMAQLAPAWTASTGPVDWMRSTSAGALVVGTSEGLKGIDTKTGQVSWTLKELARIPESGYAEIERSPFITLVPPSSPDDLYIVEPFSGTVAFNSKAAGINHISSRYFLYANNAIILAGQKADKSATMACVDMSSGQVRWTKDDSFSRITACNSAGADAILLCTFAHIYKLDAATGREIWKKAPNPEAEKMGAGMANLMAMMDKNAASMNLPNVSGGFVTTPYAPGSVFLGMQNEQRKEATDAQGKKVITYTYKTFVNAFRMEDGAYAWQAPLSMPQKLGTIVPLKGGLLIGAGDNRSVDLLDHATGAGRWGKNGKGIMVKGILAGAVEIGDQVLLTSGGEDGILTLMSASGLEIWKKPAKVSGVVRSVRIVGGDILVATDEEVDLVDLATGLSRLPKPMPGGAGLVAIAGKITYVFNTRDGLLYAVDDRGGSAKPVSSVPLVFQGKEKPTSLNSTSFGLVLSSDQNLALIATDGTLVHNTYFPAPRESGLVRALKYASAVRAAYYGASFGYTSAAFGSIAQDIQVTDGNSAAVRDLADHFSDIYGEAAQEANNATKRFWQEASARFKASASTNDIQFIMTEAGKGSFELQALSKQRGEVVQSIPLGRERTPQYEVDVFSNTVYLVEGNSVRCFRP